jgi:FkbM family methyltransferase
MQRDGELHKDRIEIQQKAVWNSEGFISFYIEKTTPNTEETWRKGISSTRSRSHSSLGTTEIKALSVRLDDFILGLDKTPRSIALWIDVEGAAYEVIEGLDKIKDIINVIQVEVETQEIWPGQKLESSVEALLNHMGFIKLTRGSQDIQHDLIYINSKTFKASPFKFKAIKILAFITSQMLRLAAHSPFLISHIKQVVLGDLGRKDCIEF